ncbi:MAG: 5-methyltetrahydrofolate--homocysteine methyltransferase [Paludibacter sp.]|nr:5-methyltetrahydrofolate--homocysteine methyltransferase [Paludibacter sp.]
MQTIQLKLSDLKIKKEEIYLHLGYGGTLPDNSMLQMIDIIIEKAYQICKPQMGFKILNGELIDSKTISVDGLSLRVGTVICRHLSESTQFAVFLSTAGKEYEDYLNELRQSGDIVSEFMADAIGSEIAEAGVRYICKLVGEEATKSGLNATSSYCPGHCVWKLTEQSLLFSLLPPEPCGITLNDSCLMQPKKSVSGIIGIGENVVETPSECDICTMKTCYKRRLPVTN